MKYAELPGWSVMRDPSRPALQDSATEAVSLLLVSWSPGSRARAPTGAPIHPSPALPPHPHAARQHPWATRPPPPMPLPTVKMIAMPTASSAKGTSDG